MGQADVMWILPGAPKVHARQLPRVLHCNGTQERQQAVVLLRVQWPECVCRYRLPWWWQVSDRTRPVLQAAIGDAAVRGRGGYLPYNAPGC
jgi:hypothetical protein